MKSAANIYLRRNGFYGASCDGTQDTGHRIAEYNGLWSVWSVDDPDQIIIHGATRDEALKAIEADWRKGAK